MRRRAPRSCLAFCRRGTRVYDNAAEFAADIPTFAHALRLRDYRTILSGKMHFCGPDQLHGFEQRLTTDIYPADFNWTPDWDRPDHRPSWYHNMSSVRDAGLCVRSNQLDFDDETAFMAERAIFDLARSRDQRPFLLVASFSHPHDPFAVPQRYWDLYRDEDIDMPTPGDALDAHSRRLRHVCAMDAEPVTEAQVRAARRAYYGAIAYVDDLLGRLMQALRSAALAEDTIVILTSDHGEMLGERGLWYKMSFLEGACPRAPRHRQSRPLRAAPRRLQRLACRSHADAHRPRGRECAIARRSASTDAAWRLISAAPEDMTKRSANILPKARSRRS